MASHVFTGTASGHKDLLARVKAHLTDPVLGGQAWSVQSYRVGVADELYLKGPGLSGADNIFVSIDTYETLYKDVYNWRIFGSVAYNPLEKIDKQPGSCPAAHFALWDSATPYWLIVNGRRFILIAKVSTTYHSMYAGFIMPYATSSEMPYPLYIAGSLGATPKPYQGTEIDPYKLRWSAGDYTTGNFWDPIQNGAFMRNWDGSWIPIYNSTVSTYSTRNINTPCSIWPWEGAGYEISWNRNGSYSLLPAVMHSLLNGGNVFGELEGAFFVSGFSNAAEDIITVGSDTYLVVQNVYRTGLSDYAAIKLG